MTHPTDDSLKPCPFCGSPAEYDDEIPLMVSVQCTQCECMTNGHGDHEEAARTWNKRAEIRSEEISLLNAPAPLLKAEQAKDAAEDAELLDWLEEKHYALHPIKEAAGDDQYTLWWQVTDKRKSISGHPLGNIRAAIRAAIAAERKAP